jgi:hypothetical protein
MQPGQQAGFPRQAKNPILRYGRAKLILRVHFRLSQA